MPNNYQKDSSYSPFARLIWSWKQPHFNEEGIHLNTFLVTGVFVVVITIYFTTKGMDSIVEPVIIIFLSMDVKVVLLVNIPVCKYIPAIQLFNFPSNWMIVFVACLSINKTAINNRCTYWTERSTITAAINPTNNTFSLFVTGILLCWTPGCTATTNIVTLLQRVLYQFPEPE